MANGFVHTVYKNHHWLTEIEGDGISWGMDATKEEAVASGQARAKEDETEHVIHNEDGTVSERNSYGKDPASRPGFLGVSPRAVRVERNQDLFGLVNQQIASLSQTWGREDLHIVCECATTRCTERLFVPFAEYEHVRANPGWFLIAPGHVDGDGEYVVEIHDGYHIVKLMDVKEPAA